MNPNTVGLGLLFMLAIVYVIWFIIDMYRTLKKTLPINKSFAISAFLGVIAFFVLLFIANFVGKLAQRAIHIP